MRCFALAEEARLRGFTSHFFLNQASPAICARLTGIDAQWTEAGNEWMQACQRQSCGPSAWWVADSYHVTPEWLESLRLSARVTYFDDLCALPRLPCDLVVNASPLATQLPYDQRLPAGSRLLAGPAYAQIRRELRRSARPVQQPAGSPMRVAVMLGGSDAKGLTLKVLTALRAALPQVELEAYMGPASTDTERTREEASRLAQATVLRDPQDLAQRLAGCDLVVTAAGGSLGELCALQQAAIALVVADNQLAALQVCPYPVLDARGGLPTELGTLAHSILLDTKQLTQLRREAAATVDGCGAGRTLDAMGLSEPQRRTH